MIRGVLAFLIAGVVLLVANENRHQLMMLELPFGFRTDPLAVASVILASVLAGALLVAIALVPAWLRASLRARRLRRELDTGESSRPTRGEPKSAADSAP
ncbi:MAG TPA: lipopolysaccharide assembly protein LapA domain-containing protein [Nitrospiria bacterium]|nr:lipopolysaccharide assembly protein LapA domain-containing protein [Nitrospiria bacterium]